MNRLLNWLLLFGMCWSASAADAPKPAPSPAAGAVAAKTSKGGDRVDEAVSRGIVFLMQMQNPEGAITDVDRRNEYQTVMTAMAALAFAAAGHQPSDNTTAGLTLRRALAFLLRDDRQMPDGYFGSKDGSRMYGHGIVSLSLAEMLGMGFDQTQDRLLRERCQRAIDLILRSQRVRKHAGQFEGGWRYTPDSGDADLSVTVWQLMALRSAKNAGLPVPKEAIANAVEYLKSSYKSARDADGKPTDLNSGFGYQPGGNPEFATTAAGLLALQVCGEYDAPEVVGATNWLLDLTEGQGRARQGRKLEYNQRWLFYGLYYYSQGMQKRGGEIARETRQFTEHLLLEQQSPDGSWTSGDGQERNAGRVYSTSLAILSLAVKYHYLPIYQN